jgi:hypothetical protein
MVEMVSAIKRDPDHTRLADSVMDEIESATVRMMVATCASTDSLIEAIASLIVLTIDIAARTTVSVIDKTESAALRVYAATELTDSLNVAIASATARR